MIDVFSYTNKGSRPKNEDYSTYTTSHAVSCFTVADGLGGHKNGEIASKLAAEYVLMQAEKCEHVNEQVLLDILNQANNIVLQAQRLNNENNTMRTTIVSAFYKDGCFRYFNVGDSRLYYFKNNKIFAQTKDHSVSQMAVSMGEITQEQIRFHDDKNKLLKVLGDSSNLQITSLYESIIVEQGDAFLLCSDGFWEYVFEPEMEVDLLKSHSSEDWVEFMVKRLLLRVSGSNDNFTVLCGMFK